MVQTRRLILIGYWRGPETNGRWPAAADLVDPSWDSEERDLVASYIRSGLIATAFMGLSLCRFCDRANGSLEFTDGCYVWPEGLSHYVTEHQVRLPEQFVQHVIASYELLEAADRDTEWWEEATSGAQNERRISRNQ